MCRPHVAQCRREREPHRTARVSCVLLLLALVSACPQNAASIAASMPPGAATPMEQQAEHAAPLAFWEAMGLWRAGRCAVSVLGGDGAQRGAEGERVGAYPSPPFPYTACPCTPLPSPRPRTGAALLAFWEATRQRAALLAFWEAMGRSKGLRASGWGNTSLPCDPRRPPWGGVHCSPTGHVDGIELPYKGPESPQGKELQGQVPWAGMTALSRLTMLDLSFNQASGPPVTPAVAAFTALQTLQLQYNKLTGPVPAVIGSLPALQILELGYNQLSGPLPSTLGLLPSLQALYVLPHTCHCKHFTNERKCNLHIPPPLSLCPFPLLITSTFSSPPPSHHLHLLITSTFLSPPQDLDLPIWFPTGLSPAPLLASSPNSTFSHSPIPLLPPPHPFLPLLIPYSRISFSNITGSLPASLLRAFSCLSSPFNSHSPIPLSSPPYLCPLLPSLLPIPYSRIPFSNITGSLPASLSRLSALSSLRLTQNLLAGPLPANLSALTALTELQLEELPSLPPPWSPSPFPLPTLASPALWHAPSLMGQTPVAPAPGASSAPLTSISDPPPSPRYTLPAPHPPLPHQRGVGKCSQLSGTLPASWSKPAKVSVNSLSGSLPASWSKLSALRQLAASSNNITGPFPAFLLSLPSIEEMQLAATSNNITVPFPSFLLSLPNIEEM
ncbi:unnamed protein product [Closterium sp. NIES-65]|nr:unnamed protein product [Closterium sp. NIES-65]